MRWLIGMTFLLLVCLYLQAAVALDSKGNKPKQAVTNSVNNIFADKINLYKGSLPADLRQQASAEAIARHLSPTLRFLYHGIWETVNEHGFIVPEFGHLFEGEAEMLFGNMSYVEHHSEEFTFEMTLRFLLTTIKSFNPTHLTSILIAYPICRRAAMAVVLEHYLTIGPFSDVEAQLITEITQHLFKLHQRSAQTKRIVELFHVSKSGGTSFCQLGRMNGCQTQSFEQRRNCLVTYFRDVPRWTRSGELGELSKKHGDPWCARYGKQHSVRWHCRARRQLLTRLRFNFYANELVMHDHNHSWVGVHPCREFLNVVIFRSPTARVISHMQNILKEYLSYYNESLWTAFDPDSPAQWKKLAVPVFDNYVVRSLLGGKAYNMPFGIINDTHLLAAKIVTLQFEVLLTLAPETSELTRDIFGLGLGWQYDLRHMHMRLTKKHAVNKFSPQVLEAVRVASTQDEQLYDFALILQLLDAITFGVAHDVAGMWGLLALNDTTMALGNTSRGCGYVGVRRSPSAEETDFVRPPPVLQLLAPYHLSGAELEFAAEHLGAVTIAGGRWFNGSFYWNASMAVEAAASAGKAKEAGLVAQLAEANAVAMALAAQAANATNVIRVAAAALAQHATEARAKAEKVAKFSASVIEAGLGWSGPSHDRRGIVSWHEVAMGPTTL